MDFLSCFRLVSFKNHLETVFRDKNTFQRFLKTIKEEEKGEKVGQHCSLLYFILAAKYWHLADVLYNFMVI